VTSAADEDKGARLLESAFLGGPAELTREQVESSAGVDVEMTRRLWRALGFVDLAPGVPLLAEADVAALAIAARLRAEQGIDARTADALARALGAAMSSLAEAQVDLVSDLLARDPALVLLARDDPHALVRRVLPLVEPIVEPMQSLLLYVWRRHLVAAAQRALAGAGNPLGGRALAVGFADVVGYTSATRDMAAPELSDLVESFESRAHDAVVAAGARVVKTLGDEVMFVADAPRPAAEAGLALAAVFAAGTPVPPVRVGLAWGPALARAGDVFGPVVNLASRCASVARPSTVLVDREMAAELAGDPDWELRRVPTRRVRGYQHLTCWVLRRAPSAEG